MKLIFFGSARRADSLVWLPNIVKQNGEAIIEAKGKPGAVPNFAKAVTEEKKVIGGLTFEFNTYKNSESMEALVIALPELKTFFVPFSVEIALKNPNQHK